MSQQKEIKASIQSTRSTTIIKLNDEERTVTGWAMVIEENGTPVVDTQDHVVDIADLLSAAHEFMSAYRKGKSMHAGPQTHEIVESIVMTKELQSALGVDLGKVGWLIKAKVIDDETWNKVKSGELKAFSIGGYGKLEDVA